MWKHHYLPALALTAWAAVMCWAFWNIRRKWRRDGTTVYSFGEMNQRWAYLANLAQCVLIGTVSLVFAIYALQVGMG